MINSLYQTENGMISGHNLPLCANRPIYCANTDFTILAGDRPFLRLIKKRSMLGALRFWVESEGKRIYFHDFADIHFFFKGGLMTWELSDSRVEASLTVTAGAPEETQGLILSITASRKINVSWQYGSVRHIDGEWNISAMINTELLEPVFEAYESNHIKPDDVGYLIFDSNETIPRIFVNFDGGTARIENHCVTGSIELFDKGFISASLTPIINLPAAHKYALHRADRLAQIFISQTPDKYLDTQMSVLASEIDGAWYPPRTMHSNQIWNAPYLGWCNRFGNILGGWFDRAYRELTYYCMKQNTAPGHTGGAGHPDRLLCEAAPDSRYYGQGRVNGDQYNYNMQSQFFDQMIFAWRMTGDKRLAELLYPALKLHTRWQDECFDDDGDGLYESYINTWPTDSVWYNGGGSCEETCYAKRSHEAALEMAKTAGDVKEAEYHTGVIDRIKKGFFEKLWLKDAGYPAMKREKGGNERLHRSAWLYNSFMPVDMDITDQYQGVTALWYSKWALENVTEPCGGRTVWLSNWVPGIWSVRENAAGENFQLAYSFFKAGFPEEGYDVLRGALLRDGFHSKTPGQIPSEAASLLARAVICGMHGYRPDYPNKKVLLAPQYPQKWDHASIKTPYLELGYIAKENRLEYEFSIQALADVTVRMPVYSEKILSVTGARAWHTEPGFGCQILVAEMGSCQKGHLRLTVSGALEPPAPLRFNVAPGDELTLKSDSIIAIHDTQAVAEKYRIENGECSVKLRDDRSGFHMLFLECKRGEFHFLRVVELSVSLTNAELETLEKQTARLPENPVFTPLELRGSFNADVRDIFKQKYLSPRHDCVHLSIGTDGYSPWTFVYWKNSPPEISLDDTLPAEGGIIYSALDVPFDFGGFSRNIVFTSLWDNWPEYIEVPVNKCASAVRILICGMSNPMECGIANAVLEFTYADGSTEKMDIIHPDNFWSLTPYTSAPSSDEQATSNDYSYEDDAFCLPAVPPEQISLGQNCRAVVLPYNLDPEKTLESITLKTLSQEVIIGLMGITLIK